jgi:hypothetical protein
MDFSTKVKEEISGGLAEEISRLLEAEKIKDLNTKKTDVNIASVSGPPYSITSYNIYQAPIRFSPTEEMKDLVLHTPHP